MLLLVVIAIGLCVLVFWLVVETPAFLLMCIAIMMSILAIRWGIRLRRKKVILRYKQLLDSSFVTAQSPPSPDVLSIVKQHQRELLRTQATKEIIKKMEADVYQAVLDRILDDGFITKEEAGIIAAAEQTLAIDAATRSQIKKEIFSAACVEAIEDRTITQEELGKVSNLLIGLAIPQKEVQRELNIVQEIVETQALSLPFEPIPRSQLAVPIQKSENAFYQCSAQVLSKRKSTDSPTGYEYSVQREGTLILTSKRVFVVGDGVTNIPLLDIVDVEVDIDEGVVEISRIHRSRPIILKIDAPIYIGRAIDLLVNANAAGNAAWISASGHGK